MENLIEYIKKMDGSTVGIGIDNEKIKNAIQNNDNIKTCYLLEEGPSFSKKKFKIFEKSKTVNIKKIKKVFKKKRIENLICNYKTIKPFLKTFVRDSVFINKGKLYIYMEEDYEEIISKYKRYTNDIKIEKNKKQTLLIINNQNTVNKKTKDIKYWWKDTLNNIADVLTNILVN